MICIATIEAFKNQQVYKTFGIPTVAFLPVFFSCLSALVSFLRKMPVNFCRNQKAKYLNMPRQNECRVQSTPSHPPHFPFPLTAVGCCLLLSTAANFSTHDLNVE